MSTQDIVDSSGVFELSPQQVAFYEAFGFLRLPGLFADEVERLQRGFEEVFATADDVLETHERVHLGERRLIVPRIVSRSEDLSWLLDDPRVTGIAGSLIPGGWEYAESDGNLMWCQTAWHCDIFNSPLEIHHLKLFFYLDPLRGGEGSLRVIPGTNLWQGEYAARLRRALTAWERIPERFGVSWDDVPAQTVDTEPGDVIAMPFRTMHATCGGGERRRLFTMSFRELADDRPALDEAGWTAYAKGASAEPTG